MRPDQIEAYTAEAKRMAIAASQASLQGFLDYLIIDSRPPQLLKTALAKEPWQADLYAKLIPLIEMGAGVKKQKQKNAFVVAPKGHSKTSMLGAFLLYLLCFSKRIVRLSSSAKDLEQAREVLKRMQECVRHNPWLAEMVEFGRDKVSGPTGELDILASDASGTSGRLDDVTLIDELTHWQNRKLWDTLQLSKRKRPDGVYIVISNAGYIASWQEDILKFARRSPLWLTHEVPAFSASWLDREDIEAEREIALPSEYRRLHLNEWTDPSEDNPLCTRQQITACVNHTQQTNPQPDCKYVLSADWGTVKDYCAAALCHGDKEGNVYLDDMFVMKGDHENRNDFDRLERWLDDRIFHFSPRVLVLDTHQLEAMAQKYEKRKVIDVERYTFGGSGHTKIAENLRTLILTRQLHLYPNAGILQGTNGERDDLVEEITHLKIEEKGDGKWRFQHSPGRHDDRAIALALGAFFAVRLNKGKAVWLPTDEAPQTHVQFDRQKALDEINEMIRKRAMGLDDHLLLSGLD